MKLEKFKKWFDYLQYSPGERKIMGQLDEVVAELETVKSAVKNAVTALEAGVEDLYEQVKQFTNEGITPAAAQVVMTKIGELRTEVLNEIAKVATDDEPMPPPA